MSEEEQEQQEIKEEQQELSLVEQTMKFPDDLSTSEQAILKKLQVKMRGIGCVNGCPNTIDFSWLRMEAIGAKEIIKYQWQNLSHLHLNGGYIGNKGCRYLVKAKWDNLLTLELYQNEIGQSGAAHLCKSQWKNLNFLHMGINFLTYEGLRTLIRADYKQLHQLYIYNNGLTYEAYGLYAISEWNSLTNLHLEISPLPLVKVEKAKRITRDKFPAALTVCI